MKDITNFEHISDEYKKTLLMLKEKEITFKGASKAFSTFLVMWFLSKKDMHGYLLMKKIDEFFTPQIELGLMKSTKANKIYPLLKNMQEKGLIESYEGIHKKKEVKIYRLTEDGKNIYNLTKKEFSYNKKRKIWIELFNDLNLQPKE